MASTPCWARRSSPTTSAVSRRIARFSLVALATLAACKAPSTFKAPIFIAGRSVATMGDSLFAVPAANAPVVLVLDRDGHVADTLGAGTLSQPVQVQALADTWFVSDGGGTTPTLFAFTADGHLLRKTSLATADPASAQFAVLPDGRVVVERAGGQLVALAGDSNTIFVPVQVGPRPSLLVGADGGVFYAAPGKSVALYNGFGHIRWRVDWPWADSAYVGGVAVDSKGRIHLISGVGNQRTFIVYTLATASGEIVRWSAADSVPTFVVDRLGALTRGDTTHWRR